MYLAIFLVVVVVNNVAARGSDLQYNMDLTLEEAVREYYQKEIRIPTLETCDKMPR